MITSWNVLLQYFQLPLGVAATIKNKNKNETLLFTEKMLINIRVKKYYHI